MQKKLGAKHVITLEVPDKEAPKQTQAAVSVEMLKYINLAKVSPILHAYKRGKLTGMDESDLKEVLKYI